MKIRKVPVGEIKPAAYNPRKDLQPGDPEYERLRRSIGRFDIVEPLVWNKKTGNLVGGHQRFKILLERGDKKVEVSVVDLDDNDEAALNVALNKISGEWDITKLTEILSELDANGYDATYTGFDEDEMARLLAGEWGLDEKGESEEFEPGSGDLDPGDDRYQEQFAVICMCTDEAHQEKVYEELQEQGYDCKVVVT